eukprot:GEMP01004991.1.p1 GENE.GEMP01004991.1~~GEMP01004991.1.p1  ORF type:complete len:1182 (+),score=262.89 GEMP01004991.1:170-3715(+)
MFVYLSKKIAIPHNLSLNIVCWNLAQGWIACGGEKGLLKVLKLESVVEARERTSASNLSMNQTLEGHRGNVMVVTWNENFRKLTTSDQNGLIIVWMLHRGIWFEEMINNRNRSVVRDMKWTCDGQRICIVYEDGAVIVGTVDGQRLWGKEIQEVQLSFVEWCPDSKNLLFCTVNGEVHVYDPEGVFSHRIPIYCLDEGTEGDVTIAGIHWYEGHTRANQECTVPSLAVGFVNGRVQVLRTDMDDKPVLIDTQLRCSALRWSPVGDVLAVAGVQTPNVDAEQAMDFGVVQFYAPTGQHLRTLRAPGQNLRSISWEGNGLRLALAVDSHIFFANVRPDYLWSYFSKSTLVYAVWKKERQEHCVTYWDQKSNEKYLKYIRQVIHIKSCREYCLLVTKDEIGQDGMNWVLIVCNDIGSPLFQKYIRVEPIHVAMTENQIVVCSNDIVYIWAYRNNLQKVNTTRDLGMTQSRRKVALVFNVDDPIPANAYQEKDPDNVPQSADVVQDPIACMCASEQFVFVQRESGVVHKYSLPMLELDKHSIVVKCRPQVIAVNCDSTRMSVLDINGLLYLYDINPKTAREDRRLEFERKDVWDMKWASDNADLFAIMEKNRMYIIRGLQPEEPVLSNAFICAFQDLQIQSVLIDELIRNPESGTKKGIILDFETKSLRDTRAILTKVQNLEDAYNYVDQNPHPRLWRLLAESALDHVNLGAAEKAFVKYDDYVGIQFIKRLKMLDDKVKQKAEVAAYFQRFDEAENLYREIDRKDLAIDLRVRLGDWFRVIQLAQSTGGSEELTQRAWNAMGEYYADRGKWSHAVQYFLKAEDYDSLVTAYYILEDYESLRRLVQQLPINQSGLLLDVGDKFASVGLCEEACEAYLKMGEKQKAIDICVALNQWDLAIDLAQKQELAPGQIETLLAQYAKHLLDKNKTIDAVNLYRKANRHIDASRLLQKVTLTTWGSRPQRTPNLQKKGYLLAALEFEKHKKKTFDKDKNALDTLNVLMKDEQKEVETNPWRGAEAFHLFMLVQRLLYKGENESAMRASLRLGDYDDILDTQTVYSLIALCTYKAKYFLQCSKAFIKLEASPDIAAEMRQKFEDLALRIFTRNPPRDPPKNVTVPCVKCKENVLAHLSICPNCNAKISWCVASGRPIVEKSDDMVFNCKTCRHPMYSGETRGLHNCPLCHAHL